MKKNIKYDIELAVLILAITGVIGLCWDFLLAISF